MLTKLLIGATAALLIAGAAANAKPPADSPSGNDRPAASDNGQNQNAGDAADENRKDKKKSKAKKEKNKKNKDCGLGRREGAGDEPLGARDPELERSAECPAMDEHGEKKNK